MASLKSSVRRLLRGVRKSRDRWKEKAQARHREIRALEVRVRDLERSREKWKARARAQGPSASDEPLERAGETQTPRVEGNESPTDRRVAGHGYPVLVVQLGLRLLLDSHQSLRGAMQTLRLFEPWLGCSGPHFTTLRQWGYRLGLYLLEQPKVYHEEWIWIVDQTLESGPQGCLVVVGIERGALSSVGFSPGHADLQVLEVAVLKHATGAAVAARLEALSERVGVPCQIVADHGSDVKKGIELFQQEHPEAIYTYDVSHALANLLKRELRNDERWIGLLKQAHQSRRQVQQTELAFLAAPRQRSKARMMASERHVRWAEQVLAYHDRGDFSAIDATYSIDWRTHEALLAVWGPAARPAVVDLHGRAFADRENKGVRSFKATFRARLEPL